MKHYAAFLEGLTAIQENQLASILFNQLCNHLKQNQKKTKFIKIDETNKKIWQKEKLFFYYNPNTQLLETEYPQGCQESIFLVSKNLNFTSECIDFFKKLQFVSSKEEAPMLNANGLLFAKTERIHKSSYKKTMIFYDGLVTAKFAAEQILTRNSGLVLGHAHIDFASYRELCKLLPAFKQAGLKSIYLELSYNEYSSLCDNFNKNKSLAAINKIIAQLKIGAASLYESEAIGSEILATARELLIAAKKFDINVYPCDIASLNFIDHSINEPNVEHRLKVGDACMIRNIEIFQFKQNHSKFLLLVGLAHAKNIAEALGVPSCFIGDKKLSQEFQFQAYIKHLDYVFTSNKVLYPSHRAFFRNTARLEQTEEPIINKIVAHWDKLIQKIPRFSSIVAREIKAAREVYIEYILEKSHRNQCEISDTCKTQQSLIIESLTQAIYSKFVELAHPKNWYPLFYCQRPYGIRLTENEKNAFTITHLNDLEKIQGETQLAKLHYA